MLFQGGFDYKKAIVDTIITIIEENTEAKEAGTFTIIFPSLSLLPLRRAILWLTTKFRVTATIFFEMFNFFFHYTGLGHLCEFIEDCEHTVLATKILHLLGREGPRSQNPSKYIRFIYNRVILENAAVRAG